MSELINNREHRIATLKHVILHLHRGEAPEQVKAQLAQLIGEVDASEIAAMEQALMAEGMAAEEVKAMCDLHAEVLQDAVAPPRTESLPAGHPVDTFRKENRALEAAVATARERVGTLESVEDHAYPAAQRLDVLEAFNVLMDVDKHYQRKENLVFSILERHGTTGPSKVMWAKDDEVRELLKSAIQVLREEHLSGAELKILAPTVLKPALAAVESMIYKEENILLPMALGMFTEEEWGEIWRDSPRYGWCLVEPGTSFAPPEAHLPEAPIQLPTASAVAFPSGSLTFQQLVGIFSNLPVDITFVDADDRVAFFSEGPDRVFARSRTILGREVKHCHPPKSVDVVERILGDFKSGRQSVAEFWIQLQGKFVHIRYFAVRDEAGAYLGTLEVTQDLTRLRALEGDRRLLEYDAPAQA
ncbi:DUF438 domain-containing protein [Geothrix sp. 21YS21S-4]|uniref:DUF438 domain-containing protein n=1 Tax=Geothrix sp. 21YS21S-4 TaxID=3068889 RepID=UPI0027B8F827|nr:DUF438 domain-containing protein [Geothrix sp. 21YS21S-4]